MSGGNYEYDVKEFNFSLEQSGDETDYEDEPTIDMHCIKQADGETNLTKNAVAIQESLKQSCEEEEEGLFSVVNDEEQIYDVPRRCCTKGSSEEEEELFSIVNDEEHIYDVPRRRCPKGSSEGEEELYSVVNDEEQIYDVPGKHWTERNNSSSAPALALTCKKCRDQQSSLTSNQDSDYGHTEYYLTREQCNEKEIPSVSGVLSDKLTILETSQYLRSDEYENILPSKSFAGVIRKKLKKIFSRKKIKTTELYTKKKFKDFVRVVDSNGNIYYEYVGDNKKKKTRTFEPLYDLLPFPKPINLENNYETICTDPPELPARVVLLEPSTKKCLKQELYYQNIIEQIEHVYENPFIPKLHSRTPLSIPYPPEFEIIDGQLTRNLMYNILLPSSPTNRATNNTENELNIMFQYELLLSLKLSTKLIYQNTLEELNYSIAVSFRLPQNMRICKPTISKIIRISETNINYKILIFLDQLPDSTFKPDLSDKTLPEIPKCSTSNTEPEVHYSNYSWTQNLFPINLSSKESKIKSHLFSQLSTNNALSDKDKGEFDVVILSFKLPAYTSSCNDLNTHIYYDIPRNNYSYSDKDLERNSSDNSITSKQISLENIHLDTINKISLNYEITLPPHISAPHPKFSNRDLPPIPLLSPDYLDSETILSRSLKALNRLSSLFRPQYEPIYEDISNFYHEIRYRNSLFVPHNEDAYLYGITGEALYDVIPGENRSDTSTITYDPVRWPMATIDKKGKPWKLIFGLLWTLVCTGMYIVDVGSDISLAFRYWSKGDRLYCCLTLSLVYLASIVDILYCIYRKELATKDICFSFRFIIMFLINLRGVFEYVHLMKLEYRIIKISFENKAMQRGLQLKRARIAALNSYEGIFEACPQLVLQLYLILLTIDKDFDVTFIMQLVTVISSLCASGAAFVNMEKGLRLEDYGENDLSVLGVVIQYLWLSPLTAARLLSVALLLLVAPRWLWLGAALHLFLGATLYWCRNEAPASPRKAINACVYGARVLVSPYEPVYVRHVVPAVNAVHVLENGAATTVWAVTVASCTPLVLVLTICAVNLAAHVIGLLFSVLFHKCKRRFYTFHKVDEVEYGYAVVQIV